MDDAGWIAVDWGTTNRRVYALDKAGAVVARIVDGMGVLSVSPSAFPDEIAALRARFGDRPMLLAGMVGSRRGWIEAPYVPCPADLAAVARGLIAADRAGAAIVPGVCVGGDGADVMRGEEVQLLGAVAGGLTPADGPACLPGTHAKWAILEGGAITDFRTVMTGELFALLRDCSVLADQLAGPVEPGPAFRRGVRRALDRCELAADLFGVRAAVLLETLAPEDAPAYASGLLIGHDVRIGLGFVGRDAPVALIGEGALTRLYAAALDEAGRERRAIDGEEAFLAGIKALAEMTT